MRRTLAAFAVASLGLGAAQARAVAEPMHAIAMHGAPALPDGFQAMPYANPQAPQGGRLVQGVLGTFDSLNPLIVKGLAAQSIRGYVIESLMARGYDEPFTLYGLLASKVETNSERSYVTFTLDPAARFSDGTKVTAQDVRMMTEAEAARRAVAGVSTADELTKLHDLRQQGVISEAEYEELKRKALA